MSKKKNITTAKNFETFKKECELWIERLGLKDWDITYKHKDMKGDCATTRWDIAARWMIITLGEDFGPVSVTDYEIKSTAFHEILEIVIADLQTIAGQRFITPDQLDTASHAVIQRLTNYFFKQDYYNR
jgi:hypothetical protein